MSPRARRGKSRKSLELVEAAASILAEIQPASVRAVCYRLFVAGYIDSMSKANTARVGRQLVWAREHGRIPWSWIVDETREAERPPSWDSPDALIRSAVGQYRKNHWTAQPHRVEVWSEKGTVRGTLAPVLERYGVTFRVMHGFGSATAVQSVAAESTASEAPLIALYVGDWDPSGLAMSERDLPERMERYHGRALIQRIALSARDTLTDGLPWFPASDKRNDPRCAWFVENYGLRCWELDALSPAVLRERVESEIVELLDREAWERSLRLEAAEIESMRDVLDAWRASKSNHGPICSPGPGGA